MALKLNVGSKKLVQYRRGQGMVDYALLVAGVALVGVVGVSMMGHKTADLIGTVASVLPGSHSDDNGPIIASQIVETKFDGTDVVLDNAAVSTNIRSLNANLGFSGYDGEFVDDTHTATVTAGN